VDVLTQDEAYSGYAHLRPWTREVIKPGDCEVLFYERTREYSDSRNSIQQARYTSCSIISCEPIVLTV